MKKLSLFSGYDGGSWAFRLENIPIKHVGFSEIDKNAIKCLQTNFPHVPQLGSITEIDEKTLPDFDLLTGGFPCQDVSVAGNRDLSKGRTELFNDVIRIANHKKPMFLWLENVTGILSAKKKGYASYHHYVLSELRRIGYGVAWKKLNSKHYNNPQNRERIWYICKLGGWDFMEFTFPLKEKLCVHLKDLLEETVDNKYFLQPNHVKKMLNSNYNSRKALLQEKDFCSCLTSRDYKEPRCIMVGDYRYDEGFRQRVDNCSPCLRRNCGEGLSSKPLIMHNLQKRSINRPSLQKALKKGKPLPGGHGHLSKQDGTSFCIDRGCSQGVEIDSNIRKLTPKECIRLMGFHNDEINLDGSSNSAIYSLAGNGWDVTVARKILKQLMKVEDFRRLV